MTREEILLFLQEVIGARNVSHSDGSEWVKASCPLAPWFHAKGRDENPSFGVHIPETPGEAPSYHCFACHRKGSLWQLLHTLTWLGADVSEEAVFFLAERIREDATEKKVVQRTRRFIRSVPEVTFRSEEAVPEEILVKFPLLWEEAHRDADAAEVLSYLMEERGIVEWVIRDYLLRFYRERNGKGVVFPIIDKTGRIVDLYVRLVEEKRFFRLSPNLTGSSASYKSESVCFGEHLVKPGQTIFLVEGALDALRLASFGEVAVASMGSFSRAKALNLPSSSVILAFDADDAGRKMAEDAVPLMKKTARLILYADWSLAGIKDPGEIRNVEDLAKVKGALRIVHPTASDLEATRTKYLTHLKTFDKIRRKIAEKRLKLSRAKGEKNGLVING